MKRRTAPARPDDGFALMFVIGFMVLVGLIAAASLSIVQSSILARPRLDDARNRQYAADSAIQHAITQLRDGTIVPAETSCGAGASPSYYLFDYTVADSSTQYLMHVDCVNRRRTIASAAGILIQRNVLFEACYADAASPQTKCISEGSTANVIIRAQVNFEADKTVIQSWSVNQ